MLTDSLNRLTMLKFLRLEVETLIVSLNLFTMFIFLRLAVETLILSLINLTIVNGNPVNDWIETDSFIFLTIAMFLNTWVLVSMDSVILNILPRIYWFNSPTCMDSLIYLVNFCVLPWND